MSGDEARTVFISIRDEPCDEGELNQRQWAEAVREIRRHVAMASRQTFAEWYSAPDAEIRSACFHAAIYGRMAGGLRRQLAVAGHNLGLDAVTWTDAGAQEQLTRAIFAPEVTSGEMS